MCYFRLIFSYSHSRRPTRVSDEGGWQETEDCGVQLEEQLVWLNPGEENPRVWNVMLGRFRLYYFSELSYMVDKDERNRKEREDREERDRHTREEKEEREKNEIKIRE